MESPALEKAFSYGTKSPKCYCDVILVRFLVTVKLGFYIFNLKIFYFCPEGGRVS